MFIVYGKKYKFSPSAHVRENNRVYHRHKSLIVLYNENIKHFNFDKSLETIL